MMREPTDMEILDILAEECNEVVHIISKIRRFGMDDCHYGKTNKGRLLEELLDVMAMIEWAELRELFPPIDSSAIRTHTKLKHDKVRKYLR